MTRVVQMFIKNSVVDPDPYWILIQELCGSESVSRIRIRIHTGEKWMKKRKKV